MPPVGLPAHLDDLHGLFCELLVDLHHLFLIGRIVRVLLTPEQDLQYRLRSVRVFPDETLREYDGHVCVRELQAIEHVGRDLSHLRIVGEWGK